MAESYALEGFGPRTTTVRRVRASSDPDTAVAQTVGLMAAHIKEDARSPIVLSAVGAALEGLGIHAGERERASAIWSYVHRAVRFKPDEVSVLALPPGRRGQLQDLLITPARLLTMPAPAGDCDDFAMAVCSMLLASGIACELCTVAADSARPALFTHVYAVALLGADRQRFALDASHGDYAGWETDRAFRKQYWPVAGGTMNRSLAGIERMKLRMPSQAPVSPIDRQVLGRGLGFDWGAFQTILTQGIDKIAAPVLTAKYGAPPPGTYTARNADGSQVQYRLGEGGQALPAFQTFPTGGIDFTTIALIGGAVVAVALLANRGKK